MKGGLPPPLIRGTTPHHSCTCLNGYNVTNSNQSISISNPCTAITSAPPTTVPTPTPTKQAITSAPPTTVPTPTPTKQDTLKSMALTVDTEFVLDLTDSSTPVFKDTQAKFKKMIDASFQNVKGFISNSAEVTKFRRGSVIADFTIKTTGETIDFTEANKQLTTNFQTNGFTVKGVIQSDEVVLYNQPIYPLQTAELTCGIVASITWTKNGIPLSNQNNKYEISGKKLTLLNAGSSDSGRYACSGSVDGITYENWQQIQIKPIPNIQATNTMTLKCDGVPVTLQCCEDNGLELEWSPDSPSSCKIKGARCITCQYAIQKDNCLGTKATCQLSLTALRGFSYSSKTIQINIIQNVPDCYDTTYGAGSTGKEIEVPCPGDLVGTITVKCEAGKWQQQGTQNCVPKIIAELSNQAQNLKEENVGLFVADLSNATTSNSAQITDSTEAVLKIAEILKIIDNTISTLPVNKPIMTSFLTTMDIIGSPETNGTWTELNKDPKSENISSQLLKSVESMGSKLSNESIEITTATSHLKRRNFSQSFNENINSTQIDIPGTNRSTFITAIVFTALSKVLPVRTSTMSLNDSSKAGVIINGDVAAVLVDNYINNISLTFDIQNPNGTLGNPQCVFWNFNLLDGIGGWDSTGCEVKTDVNSTDQVTCECNHTTSFSILMSPFVLNHVILDYITYIGVGISIICLILSLIIEGIIWKSMTNNDTAYMRHVSIVNIALSLLIADVCFLIGAGIVEKGELAPVGPCSTATFFMHFFYLALFFWMLLSALLLLYRTVVVFAGMSKTKMMIIAFTVGYGAPLLIAVITVAATAGQQGYIVERSACWLNWDKTKAFLAFVIPALTIVVINLVVLIVVLWKMLRRGVGATTQPDEKHTIVVIAKCVAILTPLFGLTWGFGIGTMVSGLLGIHIVFAILNSLQGLFILVFGILLDKKVCTVFQQIYLPMV
ncbi:adhesion G protein-coupled receptor F5 isoform X2 [Astyanax mexicanus]|uniref:adhesion G protein-coupled receptor F5 isoform X2 n=1 Tax=Astyanax mexicanus TaxID=7994 RepID=UPI0020CACC88|nr:adhesion G protein-coupled receptor F5 isoform X2 [Astyanax mexicanus]